jgi:FdhD protein
VSSVATSDVVVAESPLEIRISDDIGADSVAVTMRTPGADPELALGFLFAEGLIGAMDDVAHVGEATSPGGDLVTVTLRRRAEAGLRGLDRHFMATSSCGVCGKAGLEQLAALPVGHVAEGLRVHASVLLALPGRLRAAQEVFSATGGLHAAAAFDTDGELIAVREDIGRHNAIDKLVGWALTGGRVPLSDATLLVSGRASFEVVQKCLRAGVPVVAAVSAPSSLAADTAAAGGQTLVGFLSEARFNVYTHPERIAGL